MFGWFGTNLSNWAVWDSKVLAWFDFDTPVVMTFI